MDRERVQRIWAMSFEELAYELSHGDPGSPNSEIRKAVLDARVAEATDRLAQKTATLATATVCLAGLTVVLAVAAVAGVFVG